MRGLLTAAPHLVEIFVASPPGVVEIAGEAVAKGRPRMTRSGHAYTPAATARFEAMVREVAMDAEIPYYDAGALYAAVLFVVPYPKAVAKKRRGTIVFPESARSDLENLKKAVFDALNGVAWRDDRLIQRDEAIRVYGDRPLIRVVYGKMVNG